MAEKLNLKNPTDYHSHSLRRTGATLLAMAGRTEEQIKTMGNWSSASAVIRYIENSEVSMRNNGKALAHPEFILPKIDQSSAEPAETSTAQKSASPIVTEPEEPKALVSSADCGEKSLDQGAACIVKPAKPEADCEDVHPPPVKKQHGGIVFSGAINQVIVVSSLDAVSSIFK